MEKPKSEPHLAPASAKVSKVDFKNESGKPEKGTLEKKKGAQAGDPTREAKPSRKHVMERSGARYGIRVGFQKQVSPEAGEVQSNGRIIPPAVNRSRSNFSAGMAE